MSSVELKLHTLRNRFMAQDITLELNTGIEEMGKEFRDCGFVRGDYRTNDGLVEGAGVYREIVSYLQDPVSGTLFATRERMTLTFDGLDSPEEPDDEVLVSWKIERVRTVERLANYGADKPLDSFTMNYPLMENPTPTSWRKALAQALAAAVSYAQLSSLRQLKANARAQCQQMVAQMVP